MNSDLDPDINNVDDDRIEILKKKCSRIFLKLEQLSSMMHHRDQTDQMREDEAKQALDLRDSIKEDVKKLYGYVEDLNIL